MPETTEIKLRTGGYFYPATTWIEQGRRFLQFGYNKGLLEEIKAMEEAKYHGFDPINPRKLWSIPITERNEFQLDYLKGGDPYAPYDEKLDYSLVPTERFNAARQKTYALMSQQRTMIAHFLTRHYAIAASEMGTGKSLAAIITMEIASKIWWETFKEEMSWWYVAPKSGLLAVQREVNIWRANVPNLQFMTYQGLVKKMKEWSAGRRAPGGIILDECSKVKNPTAQMTQAAMQVAGAIRQEWRDNGYVIEMSGSPAPKSPLDWWAQAEVARPGFLKEGNIHKFKKRLAVIELRKGFDDGVYPALVTWRDNPMKCQLCGKFRNDPVHFEGMMAETHNFVQSKNEVEGLYKRLNGLVTVHFKKDCLDLPDKHYRVIEVKPKPNTLRAASLIAKTARTTIQGLTLLRELSDGFQYKNEENGTQVCPLCKGESEIAHQSELPNTCESCKAWVQDEMNLMMLRDSYGATDEQIESGQLSGLIAQFCGTHAPKTCDGRITCPTCGGLKEIAKFRRTIIEVPCPKDEAYKDLLEEHEEVGRIVTFAGFTGSIDRCVKMALRNGWHVIRMDQSAIRIMAPDGQPVEVQDFQSMFQDWKADYPRVAFIAHPRSGGMGLTLTASPTIVYFSNTFNAEDRIQSEDRIHRPGMDVNLGATIVDIFHLPSDRKVYENLRVKREMQSMTLGEFFTTQQSDSTRLEDISYEPDVETANV